jgi:hypothetical protein
MIKMKKLIIALVLLVLVGTSCRTGYGCRGNSRTMTGEGMFKRGSRLN